MKDGFFVGIIAFLCCLIPLFLIGGGLGLAAGLGTGFWILIIASLSLLILGVYLYWKSEERSQR